MSSFKKGAATGTLSDQLLAQGQKLGRIQGEKSGFQLTGERATYKPIYKRRILKKKI